MLLAYTPLLVAFLCAPRRPMQCFPSGLAHVGVRVRSSQLIGSLSKRALRRKRGAAVEKQKQLAFAQLVMMIEIKGNSTMLNCIKQMTRSGRDGYELWRKLELEASPLLQSRQDRMYDHWHNFHAKGRRRKAAATADPYFNEDSTGAKLVDRLDFEWKAFVNLVDNDSSGALQQCGQSLDV